MQFPMKQLSHRIKMNENGITLVETAIGILLISLIIPVVASWITAWSHTAERLESKIHLQIQAETALEVMREDIRTGIDIRQKGSILLFQNLDQEDIRYHVSDKGNLIRSVNGAGASVIATDVKHWQAIPIGNKGVEVSLVLQQGKLRWAKEAVMSIRGGGHE